MRLRIETGPGKPEQAYIETPIPQGPYIKLRQGDPRVIPSELLIVDRAWDQALAATQPNELINEFDLHWGYVILGNVNGKTKVVGAHYDTSD